MVQDWLTVEVVGELQECIEDGRDIGPLVSALRNTTLPGFVEYRCLGRAKKGLVPPLPPAISTSTIGRAFDALGARASSVAALPSLRIDRQTAEFHLLRSEDDLTADRWKTFTIRFARSAQGVGLHKTIADGLRAALLEMAENTILHSESDGPSLVGYRVLDGFAQFCVADLGIGVLRSLRTNPEFSHLRYDHEALREALRDGVSRFGRNRGGMGFREMFKSLSAQWGRLRLRSGQGCLTMDGMDIAADRLDEDFVVPIPGFQVTVSCRAGEPAPPEPVF
jgi:anti-sigma regulatory factor (Ser/Thr protein kinase)